MLKDKIKVGDYVRTKYGISKVEEDRRIHFGLMHPVIDILKKEVIIKSSPNIIDLIEVGDYVNGEEIIQVISDGNMSRVKSVDETYFQNDIKSIVTREQFESVKYEVR